MTTEGEDLPALTPDATYIEFGDNISERRCEGCGETAEYHIVADDPRQDERGLAFAHTLCQPCTRAAPRVADIRGLL